MISACEDKIKDEFNASSRNMPFDQEGEACGDTCVCCGKKAKKSCTSQRRIKEEGGGELRGRQLL